MRDLNSYIRSIPDFPEEGIIFRDVTSVIQDADGFKLAIDTMQDLIKDLDYDVVVGAESRGFIFGAPLAYNNHKPLVIIRKAGKLPCETIAQEYELEYGTATIEIHKDAVKPGQKVLLVDDLMATGGTNEAMEFTVRAWCKNEDYWDVYFDLTQSITEALGEANVQAPAVRVITK